MTAEIGLGLQSNKEPGAYARLARRAEAGGVDVLTVFGDLMYQPPLPALLEMAAATSRVRLGPACLNPYSMHPYEIAGQTACLDLASAGRAYLGLARGTWLGAMGIEQPDPLACIEEAAAVVAALLAGDGRAVTGRRFRMAAGSAFRFRTERPRVPLLIGTWGPRLAALAGRLADEVKIGGSANPAMVPVMRERIAVGARAVGRDPGEIGIVVGAVTVVDEDGERARSLARTEVAMYLDVVAELDPTVTMPVGLLAGVRDRLAAGDDVGAGRLVPDHVLDRFAFSGTPEQVAAQATALVAAGASRVEFGTPHGLTDEGGVGLLVDRVLPLIDRNAT